VVMKWLAIASATITLSLNTWAQSSSPQLSAQPPAAKTGADARARLASLGQQFVLDAVKMAVELPQSDRQDRLRVLAIATSVVSPTDPLFARRLSREGLRIESELIQAGEKPSVSLMTAGHVDCSAALEFVENLPPASVTQAEQSLIGAITSCPKQTLDPASRKLDAAMEKNVGAPRALMAVMLAQGADSQWTQAHVEKAFASLPEPKSGATTAEDYGALYSSLAGAIEKTTARKTGLQLLSWLAKIDDSAGRSRAIRTTSAAMRKALGDQEYRQALETDAVANTLVHRAETGRKPQSPVNPVGSVLAAMTKTDSDKDPADRLRHLPPVQRAREAAAQGFASAQSRDKHRADQYFDMAFDAVDEAWESRAAHADIAAMVQEVGEAAAQSAPLQAFERSQKLHDSSAQAIAMLAVARVVGSKGVVQ
jgi:hypothetical protein